MHRFGLDENEFSSRMAKAPHLLAPTGSDLGKYGEVQCAGPGMERACPWIPEGLRKADT